MNKWKGIEDQALSGEVDRMAAESDAASARWIEQHKSDPCEKCGTKEGVTITPTGSVAKLTPLCARCHDRLRDVTTAYWEGFNAGRKMERSKPWFKRIFA